MTDATATLYHVGSYERRVVSLGDLHGVARAILIGLATAAAAGACVAAITVAATWIASAALSTNPYAVAKPPIAPPTLAVGKPDRPWIVSGSGRVATASAAILPTVAIAVPDTTDVTGSVPAGAGAPGGVAPMPPRSLERADILSSPPPELGPRPVKTESVRPPGLTQVANLTPAAAPAPPIAPPLPQLAPEWASSVPLPQPRPAKPDVAPSPAGRTGVQVAILTPPPAPEKSVSAAPLVPRAPAASAPASLPDREGRTALYDIAAHTVYLPNGEKLEAHSGLGDKLDDPRYVTSKNRGPTPPNVYRLALREQLFHGVRAIRLNPVEEGKMFGRDGMLAHSYMLGPYGESNGCVSFRDYPAFLHAVMRGEVDRLVVVPGGGAAPPRTAGVRRGHASHVAFNNR
jgi:hypothetical protein